MRYFRLSMLTVQKGPVLAGMWGYRNPHHSWGDWTLVWPKQPVTF